MKSDRNISISEFAEDVLGVKLMAYQKEFLEKLYEVYKKDPENFKIDARIAAIRGGTCNILFDLIVYSMIIDKFYKFENEEVKENE